jgi:hypothetical protein
VYWGESSYCNLSMILCILLGVALCSFVKFSSLNSVLKLVGNGTV